MLMSFLNHSLLSQNGIPKLRRVAKDRLKFKGKGHEVGHLVPSTIGTPLTYAPVV